MKTTWNTLVDGAIHDEVRATLPPIRCTVCGDEIFEGDPFLIYEGDPYCSEGCIVEQMIDEGLVKHAVRGEEVWR